MNPRTFLRTLRLVALASTASTLWPRLAADSTVVFNEVHYHPVTAEEQNEWVELHNPMSVNVDISNWRITRGVEFTFPEGTVVPGGGYLVVANSPGTLRAATGITNVVGPFTGRLSNSGERLRLVNNNNRTMDEVDYGTSGEWPVSPDGTGVTLSKRQPNLASDPASNWRASAQIGGTPGRSNFPTATESTVITLVATGDAWRFLNAADAPPATWKTTDFDDRSWRSSATPFYGGDIPAPATGIKPIPGLFNTGLGNDRKVLPPGATDPHFTVLASAHKISPPPPTPALVIEGHPAWMANDADSSWIGPVNPGTANVAAGNYRYHTSFDLTGFDPASAVLKVTVAADNRLSDILINQRSLGLSFVGFTSFSPEFTITNGFIPGVNALVFFWANDDVSANPAGFRAKITGSARAIASPDSALAPVRTTTYFRRPFVLAGNPLETQLEVTVRADDGAVVYLNGVEILRANMPDGPVSHVTTASTPIGASPLESKRLVLPNTRLLATGTNVLAVEIHQAASGLNDVWFDLAASASPAPPPPDAPWVFNEVGPDDEGFFVELVNTSNVPASLAGYQLILHREKQKDDIIHAIDDPAEIPARGYRVFTPGDLGTIARAGDMVRLVTPGQASVADAVVIPGPLAGRLPDATGAWFRPSVPTPGAPNTFNLETNVVLNEIFYNPHDSAPAPTWVELFNRGSSAADLSGWRFDSGIQFQFPAATTIPPGGYLVVANDPAAFLLQHPGINAVGPYTGTLSRKRDRLILKNAAGNPVDEVAYLDGGRWPPLADGGGSSLELRSPSADNSLPESWAASRESGRATWKTYTYRGVAVGSPGPTLWREFVLGLLDAGECLIDDLKVVESPDGTAVSMLQNGGFENGAASWRFLGTHRRSGVIEDPDQPGNRVLRLVADGPTEHMHNHIETTFAQNRSVVNGRTYEVSFRAKWIAGNNQLNTRLYFNRVARTTVLNVPASAGTPGTRNSVWESNIGPAFSEFRHSPVVPAANQAVTVSARINDPDGVKSARLFWAANGGAWQSKAMSSTQPDLWSAAAPASAAGTVVQFYIEATDNLGAVSRFPAAGPDSRALFIVNDQRAVAGPLHNLRILMTPADTTLLHAPTNVMSNQSLGATIVYDEQEVFYDAGVHLQGSQRGRLDGGRVGFTIRFPEDRLFRGVHDGISIDRSGGYTGVGADQDEIVLKHVIQHAGGLPGMYDDLVRVIPPRSDLTGPGLLILAKYGDEFLNSQYDRGSEGPQFKLELIYYPTTTVDGNVQSPKMPQPDEVLGVDLTNLGDDPEVYRWFFLQENNRSQNDYSPVITLAKAMTRTGTALDTEAKRLMDVDQWMRAVAFQILFGLVDTFPFDNPHNFIIYFRPEDGRAVPFLWDMDFNFGAAPNAPINRATGNLQRLMTIPGNQRVFQGHLLDIITTTYNTNYLTPWLSHYGGLVGQNFNGIRNYVDQRVKSVRSQLAAKVPFGVTTGGGADVSVITPTITLSGRAWIDIRDIQLPPSADPATFRWTAITGWQVTANLQRGTNLLQFVARNFNGEPVATNSIRVITTAVDGQIDTDADGMPDAWELANGLNPNVPDDLLDPDADGMTNAQEYGAGTDPQAPGSVLRVEAVRSTTGVRLRFTAQPGRTYTLLEATGAAPPVWRPMASFGASDTPVLREIATDAPGTRWFRVVTPALP